MSLSIQEKLAFEEAVKHGIINLADVLEKNEIMKNKEILEQHEQFTKYVFHTHCNLLALAFEVSTALYLIHSGYKAFIVRGFPFCSCLSL